MYLRLTERISVLCFYSQVITFLLSPAHAIANRIRGFKAPALIEQLGHEVWALLVECQLIARVTVPPEIKIGVLGANQHGRMQHPFFEEKSFVNGPLSVLPAAFFQFFPFFSERKLVYVLFASFLPCELQVINTHGHGIIYMVLTIS